MRVKNLVSERKLKSADIAYGDAKSSVESAIQYVEEAYANSAVKDSKLTSDVLLDLEKARDTIQVLIEKEG